MKRARSAPVSLEPIFFGDIDPDNHRNHREYEDALTCVRCGKAVREGGFVIVIQGGDFIVATGTTGKDLMEWALGSECARRVPPTHRTAMDAAAFDRMMTFFKTQRAERDARRGDATDAYARFLSAATKASAATGAESDKT